METWKDIIEKERDKYIIKKGIKMYWSKQLKRYVTVPKKDTDNIYKNIAPPSA